MNIYNIVHFIKEINHFILSLLLLNETCSFGEYEEVQQ